jgi:hypothetical protein
MMTCGAAGTDGDRRGAAEFSRYGADLAGSLPGADMVTVRRGWHVRVTELARSTAPTLPQAARPVIGARLVPGDHRLRFTTGYSVGRRRPTAYVTARENGPFG